MDRKSLVKGGQQAYTPEPAPRTRFRRRILAYLWIPVLLAIPVGVMLLLGPPAGHPNAGVGGTIAWHTNQVYEVFERGAANASQALLHIWRKTVVHSQWDFDSILLIGGLVFVLGAALLCRRVGR